MQVERPRSIVRLEMDMMTSSNFYLKTGPKQTFNRELEKRLWI